MLNDSFYLGLRIRNNIKLLYWDPQPRVSTIYYFPPPGSQPHPPAALQPTNEAMVCSHVAVSTLKDEMKTHPADNT